MKPRRPVPAYDEGTGGFTLLETLVVLAIFGLAMSVSAHTLWSRPAELNPDALAGQIRQVLHSAHLKALVSGGTTSVKFDLQSRQVSGDFDATTISIPDDIGVSLLVGRELIETENQVPVYFFGQGGSTGLRIELSDRDGRHAVVQTNWLTGATRIVDDGQ